MSDVTRFDCEETFRRLDDYVDRALAANERRLVEEHLVTCLQCAREYRFERDVVDQVRGAIGRLDVPQDLFRKVADQLDAARKKRH